MNVWLFSVGILVFLLTVYGTVMIGGYQLRMARLDQPRQYEESHGAEARSAASEPPARRR